MVAFRDNPEAQRRGAVTVGWGVADPRKTSHPPNSDLHWKLPKLNEGSPMRLSATHMCCTDEVWKDRLAMLTTALNKHIQVRIRVHYMAQSKNA
mmetsp:Transcript_35489/g.86025  ORF Transcript_35489/g.86025 Transcript_35489/m.86025 type:complete len:94 (+) Transcript_35489:108-389(+)